MTDMNAIFADARELVRREQAVERACAGIPTEALEAGVVGEAFSLLAEVQERCDLVKSMNGSYGHWSEVAGRTSALLRQIKGDQHDVC